ncbi:MAG TPA: hypothetical protein VG796_10455 [Verrucomicrobiales bacterium]|nr:hypothetical protein [Verrucomicrobiales bacterium]
MKRLLTKLLICAAAFGTAFAAARSGHIVPELEVFSGRETKFGSASTPAPKVRYDAESELKSLLNDLASAREKTEAMTPEQIRECLDALCATGRLDYEAFETGQMLVTAWAMREPFAAFRWCQSRHFEFAGACVPLFEAMASADAEQTYALGAELKTAPLREAALGCYAAASRPGEERATLDRLLACGAPGENAAANWLAHLAVHRPAAAAVLKKHLAMDKNAGIKWRSKALESLTSPLSSQQMLLSEPPRK